jgi:hypothetical protein
MKDVIFQKLLIDAGFIYCCAPAPLRMPKFLILIGRRSVAKPDIADPPAPLMSVMFPPLLPPNGFLLDNAL